KSVSQSALGAVWLQPRHSGSRQQERTDHLGRLLNQPDDLQLFGSRIPHSSAPSSAIMLFFHSPFLSTRLVHFHDAIWHNLSPPLTTRRKPSFFGCMKQEMTMVTLQINGNEHRLDIPEDMPLLWVLRDVVGLTGTKFGCGIAQCGACTVHIDGRPIRSCVIPAAGLADRTITTIEAIGETPSGRKVQQACLDMEVIQCGYCQSGQIMSAAALLANNPNPSDADIDAAMSGNICRCGTYQRIRTAIKQAAQPG